MTVATTPRSHLQPFPVVYSYSADDEWECGVYECGSVASVVSGDSEEDSSTLLYGCGIQDSGMDGSDRS